MTLIAVFRQAFGGPDGVNQGAKTASIPGPLMVVRRGANLPYFGKQSVKKAHSPQEQKRGIFWGFPGVSMIEGREKEPVKGIFSLRVLSITSQGS